METHRRYTSTTAVVVVIVLLFAAGNSNAFSPEPISGKTTFCGAAPARMPPRVQIANDLLHHVGWMLARSPTFRRQCRRIAGAPLLYVRVRYDGSLVERSFRARTVIQRYRSGVIIAVVEIRPGGLPEEWIAHEFEHILEQVEGVPLPALAGRTSGVWRSAPDVFETDRAMRAGRTVAGEMQRPGWRSDILVE